MNGFRRNLVVSSRLLDFGGDANYSAHSESRVFYWEIGRKSDLYSPGDVGPLLF